MTKRQGTVVCTLIGVVILAILASSRPASACANCYYPTRYSLTSWCKPVMNEETGVTDCEDYWDPFDGSQTCMESGSFCSVVSAGGGGSTGGGSGGGGGCTTSGFCPASCFSCGGGGGGRPAV